MFPSYFGNVCSDRTASLPADMKGATKLAAWRDPIQSDQPQHGRPHQEELGDRDRGFRYRSRNSSSDVGREEIHGIQTHEQRRTIQSGRHTTIAKQMTTTDVKDQMYTVN